MQNENGWSKDTQNEITKHEKETVFGKKKVEKACTKKCLC